MSDLVHNIWHVTTTDTGVVATTTRMLVDLDRPRVEIDRFFQCNPQYLNAPILSIYLLTLQLIVLILGVSCHAKATLDLWQPDFPS